MARQRLEAGTWDHIEVKCSWPQQAMDEKKFAMMRVPTESWKLMNLMGMNLVAGVECLVQQPRDKIMGTMIPDRDMDHEKRNCQRGFESLKTIDGETAVRERQ